MEKNANLKELIKISEPKVFPKGEYICSEGEVGEEMFIVLQGKVEVYINSGMDDNVMVAQLGPGEFFGEMAIFEKKNRSASCVAAEDTSCIAINEKNLKELIRLCPEIVEKLLYGLSRRIREMNDKLYKKGERKENISILPFRIPEHHASVKLGETSDCRYMNPIRVVCPLCGSHIVAQNINFHKVKVREVRCDQRKIFDKPDVLWHYIRSCPECGYTNFYVNFGQTAEMPIELAKEAVEEETRYFEKNGKPVNKFDNITARYYKAIHFNECIFKSDTFILGKLWLYLYWIYEDAGNTDMCGYCADRVLLYYRDAYDEKRSLLKREYDKQQCAMVIAEMLYYKKEYIEARQYYHEVMNYSNSSVYDQAYGRVCELRKMEMGIKNGQ